MKKSLLLLYPLCLITLLIFTRCAEKPEIPEILQQHPARATFTKLDKGAEVLPLFNGSNLDGWYTWTENLGKNHPDEKAFTVVDGTVRFDGQPMGYIATNDIFSNYYLKVVFRWGEQRYPPRENSKRDSGILYHFPLDVEDKLWPSSIECQIQEGDCGDYWFVGGTYGESPNTSTFEWDQIRVYRTEDREIPRPAWNTVEVICIDDWSEHYVNGHLVNEATKLSLTEGKILLQLEGAEVYYKTIELIPLK